MSETNTVPASTAAPAKKAPVRRVYTFTDREGKDRHVEATSPAAAVTRVYKPHISRPLGGGEVSALHRAKVKIEIAGEVTP